MASYGKKSYWNARYALETEPCDWIVDDFSVFESLLAPSTLEVTSAPPPGGEIVARPLRDVTRPEGHPSMFPSDQPPLCPSLEDEEEEPTGTAGGKAEGSARGRAPAAKVRFPPREECRVLHVGCGNSRLGEMLLLAGFGDVVNVDFSEVVVEKMRAKYNEAFLTSVRDHLVGASGREARDDRGAGRDAGAARPQMTFEYGDIVEGLRYPEGSFDLIVMKKTLDSILCSAGSVADARLAMAEVFRLLDGRHGALVILSSAKPEDRAVFFEGDPWSGVLNIKLPGRKEVEHGPRKGHERKKIESYAYILFKQGWHSEVPDL
ncbi:hypothetical protein ACHAWF_014842 [Thalassiosira exigua]